MLEIGQALDTSLLTPLTTGFSSTTSTSGTATSTIVSDSVSQSDAATFLSEYNKLDETEQQEVVDFLNDYKETLDEGGDTTALMEEIPDFLKRMLEADIGSGEETESTGYSSALSDQYQRQQAGAAGGGGMGVSPEQMVAGALTALEEDEAGVVDESVEAANSAPTELQQLADGEGASLSTLLKQYLDAGLTKEAAYERVEADLRKSGDSSGDEKESTSSDEV